MYINEGREQAISTIDSSKKHHYTTRWLKMGSNRSQYIQVAFVASHKQSHCEKIWSQFSND